MSINQYQQTTQSNQYDGVQDAGKRQALIFGQNSFYYTTDRPQTS